jgi:hypothetical protein
MHRTAENRRAIIAGIGRVQHRHGILPEKDVVAQDQYAGFIGDEAITSRFVLL